MNTHTQVEILIKHKSPVLKCGKWLSEFFIHERQSKDACQCDDAQNTPESGEQRKKSLLLLFSFSVKLDIQSNGQWRRLLGESEDKKKLKMKRKYFLLWDSFANDALSDLLKTLKSFSNFEIWRHCQMIPSHAIKLREKGRDVRGFFIFFNDKEWQI